MKKALFLVVGVIISSILYGIGFTQVKTIPSTMTRKHDPVQVPGELLTPLIGKKLENLRLFSYRNGAMSQMVYQFDERLADGTFILNLGITANADKANKILDPQDFLVFRIADTGDQVPREFWLAQEGVEIELQDPLTGGKSYCYLFHFGTNPPPRIKDDTISLGHWDPWKKSDLPFIVQGFSYTIEGYVNKIGNRYYKTALNKTFYVPQKAGGTNVNLLDGMRLRAFVELFFGKTRLEFNEHNLIGGIDAINQGSVRGFGLQWLTASLPMGLEGPRMYSDVFTYDRIVVAPMKIHIPIDPKRIITRAGIEYGYDLSESAYGMKYYSANCPDGVVIDGKMSEQEKNMPKKWSPWFIITGPQGSLIFRVYLQKGMLDQVKANTYFIDDRSQAFPPESIPGSIGYGRNIVEITSVKPGLYDARIEWYFPPHFYKNNTYDKEELKQFFNILDNPIVIKASGKTAKNQALNPPKLYPKKS